MDDSSGLLVARVGVENCAFAFDTLFSFSVPPALAGTVVPGGRVRVPFGRGNTLRQGFVFAVEEETAPERELKPVFSAADEAPLLNAEMLALAGAVRESTFSTWFASAKAALPGGMCLKNECVFFACDGADGTLAGCGEFAREIWAFLRTKKNGARESELCRVFGAKQTGGALRALLSAGVVTRQRETLKISGDLTLKKLRLTSDDPASLDALTEKQRAAAAFLLENGAATGKEVTYYTGVSAAVLARMKKNGVLAEVTEFVSRRPESLYAVKRETSIVLSEEQTAAYRTLLAAYRKHEAETALLFGVTGSGKTNVYLSLIDEVLKDGRRVIVLVPEISLTPQTVATFVNRFGGQVAVMHSGLSVGERRDEFFRIKRGEAKVVVGTRSAVFAPLDNVGAIIIDEEQEHTYQSEMSPRYDARAVARLRCRYHGALLVLASATPSVETYARAIAGKYLLCELTKRYGAAVLPTVIKADMSDRETANPFSAFSAPLEREIEKNVAAGEQTILLVNRRGFNTFVVCRECKAVMTCPHCSISMTYHAANNRLMCHYCGYSLPYRDRCPTCGAANIRYSGFGTQRVEQELAFRFPAARVLRMDADTTTGKNAHETALSAFAAGEYDILVGTQMVAKGLDFPNVSLVGVISADNEMYGGDFRGAEKTFALITQVIGRAGRGEKKGRAVLQTFTPDNAILDLAAAQDYKAFFAQEIELRRAMIYPPFCDICLVSFSGPDQAQTSACAAAFFGRLIQAMKSDCPEERMILLGPLPHKVSKVNDLYRQKLLVKCRNSLSVRRLLADTMRAVSAEKAYKNISLFAVMNPERTD